MAKPDLSHPGTTSTTVFGQIYAVRADWADASSEVEALDGDEWVSTGRTVADYLHSNSAALLENIRESFPFEIDAETEAEIEAAMSRAE